jgi:hypothetical protein
MKLLLVMYVHSNGFKSTSPRYLTYTLSACAIEEPARGSLVRVSRRLIRPQLFSKLQPASTSNEKAIARPSGYQIGFWGGKGLSDLKYCG